MTIQLFEHISYSKLLRFTLPSIIMMFFSSLYGVVDGFFISNCVGKTSFAAVNYITPLLMILDSVGFMIGSDGSALISKTMGEGNDKKANQLFSLFVYAALVCGIVLTALGIVFIRAIAGLLVAEGEMLNDCVVYGRIILVVLPFYIIQFEFQSLFVAAGKSKLGLGVTIAARVTNIVLDVLFMMVFKWGLVGAAIATAISQLIGGIIPLIYFLRPNTSRLKLMRTTFDAKALLKACSNGLSELMSNISSSIVSMLYNAQLLAYAGENGVAAYGVLMYVNMIFIAAFIGYSVGISPVVGFNYGAENNSELKNLLRKTCVIISTFSIIVFASSELLARPLAGVFVRYDANLMDMTVNAFRIFSFSFLFTGFSIFSSAFFTALNDGVTSAVISFLRTLVFQTAAVLILPVFFKLNGIWFSIVLAEVISFIISVIFIMNKRKKYGYM